MEMTDLLDCIENYDYALPEKLIASVPAQPRDSSRLMVLERATGKIHHATFSDLPRFFDSNDCLLANNTRVLKARLLGKRLRLEGQRWVEGGKVEFVLLEQLGPRRWEGLFHASARYVAGLRFRIPTPDGKGLEGWLVRGSADSPHGTVEAEFDRDPVESGAGELPLPHYMQRAATSSDERSYQTVYAKENGSAAAPTAGLHFTPEVLQDLAQKGIGWSEITLHVGLGTFRPIKERDLSLHRMHEERYSISTEIAHQVMQAKRSGKRIVAVGTTSVRALESAWERTEDGGALRAGVGRTTIFIRPGAFQFRVVDRLITNFHLPRSSLLLLVSAFTGRELVLRAYREAVEREYRFFSYGDAMLIL